MLWIKEVEIVDSVDDLMSSFRQSNLEMVMAVPWRKNEDDPKMDGERLKSEVIVIFKEYKEKLEA